MKLCLCGVAAIGIGLAATGAGLAQDCVAPPGLPAALTVRLGLPGQPPEFTNPAMLADAGRAEIEIWAYSGGTSSRLVQAEVQDSTGFFFRNWTASGSGPGGHLLFPAGSYGVQWRGHNDCGTGPWSPLAVFEVSRHTSKLVTRIIRGPAVVGSSGDVAFDWTNNFADSLFQVQIRRGTRVVRGTNGPGALARGEYGYNRYEDRPASPVKELPNGNYTFRVRAYSPVLKRWSAWREKDFRIARGAPRKPALSFTQQDFGGRFARSHRPFFRANYGYMRTPALWTFFDVRRKVGSRLRVVRRQWVSRYEWGYGIWTGLDDTQGRIWFGGAEKFRDLPAGTYVWRARAWNGPGASQSKWTTFKSSKLVAAGMLTPPDASRFQLLNGAYYGPGGEVSWLAVPNVYTYNLEIQKDGAPYATYANLDVTNINLWIDGTWVNFFCPVFPDGTYRFRVQAVNLGNPPVWRYSEWSPYGGDFTVP